MTTDTTAPLRTDCDTCHHSLDDHSQSLRCKVCKQECGIDCSRSPVFRVRQ